jgi:hypothetical protein
MTPGEACFGSDGLLPIRLAACPRQKFHLTKREKLSEQADHLREQTDARRLDSSTIGRQKTTAR